MEVQNNSNDVEVTINRAPRVLHFSDGVEEEIEQENITELNSELKAEETVDPVSFTTILIKHNINYNAL